MLTKFKTHEKLKFYSKVFGIKNKCSYLLLKLFYSSLSLTRSSNGDKKSGFYERRLATKIWL